MSHFAAAVFFEDGGKSVEELLQPYHEFECDGEDDEFVVDVDKTEEAKEDYKKYGSAGQSFLSFVKDWYGIECVHDLKNVRKNSTHKYGYVLANNAKFDVLRRVSGEENDIEVLPMWEIKFNDGFVTLAYPEEIVLCEMIANGYKTMKE